MSYVITCKGDIIDSNYDLVLTECEVSTPKLPSSRIMNYAFISLASLAQRIIGMTVCACLSVCQSLGAETPRC